MINILQYKFFLYTKLKYNNLLKKIKYQKKKFQSYPTSLKISRRCRVILVNELDDCVTYDVTCYV